MIIPALLTDNVQALQEMVNTCKGFTDYVQIDIMDGIFVPSKSIAKDALGAVNVPMRSEAHLMVVDPLCWVETFKILGSERIIFHYEIDADKDKIISSIRAEGLSVGMALNPQTTIEDILPFVDTIDAILFLSVNPGFYGAAFMPEVLTKIRAFKKRYPEKEISIDGGIKLDNVKEVALTGVDSICVGSALMKQASAKKAYEAFLRKINE